MKNAFSSSVVVAAVPRPDSCCLPIAIRYSGRTLPLPLTAAFTSGGWPA